MILPGAGRIWKAERKFLLTEKDFVCDMQEHELLIKRHTDRMFSIFWHRGGWIDSLPGISDYIKFNEDKARILEDDRLVLDLARRGPSVESGAPDSNCSNS